MIVALPIVLTGLWIALTLLSARLNRLDERERMRTRARRRVRARRLRERTARRAMRVYAN